MKLGINKYVNTSCNNRVYDTDMGSHKLSRCIEKLLEMGPSFHLFPDFLDKFISNKNKSHLLFLIFEPSFSQKFYPLCHDSCLSPGCGNASNTLKQKSPGTQNLPGSH